MEDSNTNDKISKLAGKYRIKAYEALSIAADRRDPALFYHILSSLTRNFHGWSVKVPWNYPEYYKEYNDVETRRLPPPYSKSGRDVLEVIRARRSRREYSREKLSLKDLSTILYYTLGITGRAWWGGPKRTYPSAGGLQPVEAYVVSFKVEDLETGVYHYNPRQHLLELIRKGDFRIELYHASLNQEHVYNAPANIILTAYYPRTASQYQVRAYRYILLDTGFAGENLYLVAEALGLATVAVGAFYDDGICGILSIDCSWEFPLLIFPIARRFERRYLNKVKE